MSFFQKPSLTWQKFRDFVSHPTHSRTMGILVMLVLISAVSLTVIVSQQPQNIRQRAAEQNPIVPQCPSPTNFSCSVINSSEIRGDWTQITGYGSVNYLLSACPPGNLLGDPDCASSTTSGSYNYISKLIPGKQYTLAAKVSSNGNGCTTPSLWSNTATCTIPLPTPTPTPTPTPAPTAAPTPTPVNNALLVLTLNAQDVPIATDSPLLVNLALYNLTTNDLVADATKPQSFTKTLIPGKQYKANISLTNLQQNKYFIVARKDNMIAKSVFTVSGTNETITVPTTTLVFGDIDNNDDINVLDFNTFKVCWKKTAADSCGSSDFDKNGVINQFDYNTYLRGFATWINEGK